jgi:hypothetical protein
MATNFTRAYPKAQPVFHIIGSHVHTIRNWKNKTAEPADDYPREK